MSDLNEYMDRMKREDRTAKDKQINQMLGEVGLDSTGTAIPDWQPAKKKEPAAVNQPSTSGLVRSVEDLWLGVREGSAGFYQLGANAFGLMDSAASRISKWTGMPKGGGLGAVSAFLKDAAMQTAPKPQDLEGRDNFISYLYRAIGSAPVTIGTYVAGGSVTGSNIAGMALIDALRHVDEGMWPAVKSGLQGALLGTGLKMIEPFSRPVRAALGGTTFAGLTAAQGGSTPEILAQGVVGGGMAALAPTKTPEIKTDKSQVIEADRPKATPMQDLTTKPSGPTIELPDQTKPKAEGGKTEGKADVELARAMPDLTPEGKPDPVSLKMAEELENAKIEADAYMREKGLTKAYWEVKKNTVDPEARRVVERTEHQLKEEQQYGTVEEQLASDPILKSLVEKPVEPATATTEGTLPQHPMDDMPFFANQIYKAAGELDVTPQAMVNSMKLTSLVETPAARRARLDTPESREAHKKVSEWAKQELEKLKLERQEKTALGELVQGLKKKIVEERGSIPVGGGGEGGGEPKDPGRRSFLKAAALVAAKTVLPNVPGNKVAPIKTTAPIEKAIPKTIYWSEKLDTQVLEFADGVKIFESPGGYEGPNWSILNPKTKKVTQFLLEDFKFTKDGEIIPELTTDAIRTIPKELQKYAKFMGEIYQEMLSMNDVAPESIPMSLRHMKEVLRVQREGTVDLKELHKNRTEREQQRQRFDEGQRQQTQDRARKQIEQIQQEMQQGQGQVYELQGTDFVPKEGGPTTTRQKMLGEGGFSTFDINFAIARTLAGAIYGYSQGDTMEERLKNALIYGTIGSLANPMMIKTIIKSMKGLDPEGIKRIEMRDKGYTPTVAEGFDAAAKDVKKMSEFLRSTNEGIEVKGRVDGINYDHINTPMDVKYTIGKMAKVYQDELNKVRKVEGVPHEELIAQAGKLAETKKGAPARIYNWPDGKPMTDRELLLTRVMRNDLGKGLHDATAKFLSDNSNTNLIEFIDTFNKYRMVQSVYAGQATGRGRGLEALKINVGNSGEVEFHRMLGDVIESIDPTGWTPQRLAGAIAQVPDINALNRAVDIAARPGMHDMLLEAFYGVSMLSNPKTWVVNMTSAPIALGWQVAKRSVAAGFTALQGKVGNPDYVQPNEPLMMMQAIKDSYHDAFIVAKEAFVKGERQYPYTYGGKAGLARPNAITYDNLRALHPEAFNAAEWALSNMGIDAQKLKFGIDLLGNAARVSTRLMLAPDEFNELIGARMELYARTARSTAAEGLSLSETAALAKRKVYSQEGFSNADKEAAKTFALYNTFNQEPGSVTTRLTGVIESLNKSPDIDPVWYLATKAVVPFITIPANIARWAARESGPTAFLSRQLKEQMAKGGAEAQTAWAGVALGSMLLTVAANLAMNGYVTGAAPVQKADRLVWEADGNIEYGAKIPGVGSFGINRIDPIAIPFAWAADFVNLSGHLDAYDGTTLAATALLTLTHDLASKNYVQGVTNFLHAITSQDSKELQTFAKGQTGSLLTPGIVRGIRQETDPYRRATNTTFDAMRQSTPWGSTDYPGVLDRFGRPIYSGYGAGPEWARIFGIINPIQYRAANDSAVIKEVTGNNIPIPGLSDTIYGAKDNPYDNKPLNEKNGIKLEGWEYYLYNKYSGEKLFGLLEREVKTERWRQASPGPTGGKALIFNTLVTAADEYARKKLLDESPELRGAYRQKLEARKEALKPVPGQISVPSY